MTTEQILNERIKEAIATAVYAMGIDGVHHKAWALDKIVKDLAGEDYDNVVENFKADTGKEWDTGIEP